MNHPITPAGGQPANLPAETSATLQDLLNVRIPANYDPISNLVKIAARSADLTDRIDPPADDETGEIPEIGRPIRPEEIRDLGFRVSMEAIRLSFFLTRKAERISQWRGRCEFWIEAARSQAAQPIADMQHRIKVALEIAEDHRIAGDRESQEDPNPARRAFRRAQASEAILQTKAKAFDDLVQIIHCSGLDLAEIAAVQAEIRQDQEADRKADLAIKADRAAADQKGAIR